MNESKVLTVVEGVEGVGSVNITEAMVKVFARRHNVDYTEENLSGLVGSVAAYVDGGAGGVQLGQTSGDSFLFESPETRDLFAPVRRALELRTSGREKPENEYSKVSILEVIPEWESFKETL